MRKSSTNGKLGILLSTVYMTLLKDLEMSMFYSGEIFVCKRHGLKPELGDTGMFLSQLSGKRG